MADASSAVIEAPTHVDNAPVPDKATVVAADGGDEGYTQVSIAAPENDAAEGNEAKQTKGEPKATLDTLKVGDKAPETTPAATTTIEEAIEAKSVDMEALAKEYVEQGGLTEKTYQDLATKGFTKDIVDTYIEGRKAQMKAYNDDLAASVGGTEGLTGVLSWAAENLTEAEKAAANSTLASMNKDAAKMVLAGLKARYEASVGREPRLVQAAPSPAAAGPQPYESNAEMLQDMMNPKYKSDPAFRRKVEARLAAG